MRFKKTAAVVAAASLVLAAFSSVPAQADQPFVPDNDDVVGVGAAVTDDLFNDLAGLVNNPPPTHRLVSFDSTGPTPIQIRPGVVIPRPNSCDQGLQAMATKPIDFVRCSRGPRSTDPADFRWLGFATDPVRWMGNDDITGVTSLTDSQLTGIYNCTITNWATLGGPNLLIRPVIPAASNSPLRAFWSEQVGINPVTPPACVTGTIGGVPVEEGDPTLIAAASGAIAPVAVRHYNWLTPSEKAGTFLGTIPSPDDFNYNQVLYNVVRLNAIGEVPAHVADFFGDGSGGSSTGGIPFICEPSDPGTAQAEAGEVIEANGFTQLPLRECGIFG